MLGLSDTFEIEVTMSYLNKNRKQSDLAIAFLRSNKACVYCQTSYDLTFEFEHVYADKNDTKALISCGLCNRSKSTKTLLAFVRGNVAKKAAIESLLSLDFGEQRISEAIKELAKITVTLAFENNRPLTTSDCRFICTPKGRLETLPNGLKLDVTKREFELFRRVYDTSNLDVYFTD